MLKPLTISSIAPSIVACASASSWEVSRQLSPNSLFAYSESQVTAHGLMLGDSSEHYPAFRVATALTPNDWQVAFTTDRAALSKVQWSAGDLWTDVLHEWGEQHRLNIMLDGANRIAVVSNEQARRAPGVQWVNSQNALHQEMYAPQYRFNEYKKYQTDRVAQYLGMPKEALGDLNETQARLYMLLSIEQQAAPRPVALGEFQASDEIIQNEGVVPQETESLTITQKTSSKDEADVLVVQEAESIDQNEGVVPQETESLTITQQTSSKDEADLLVVQEAESIDTAAKDERLAIAQAQASEEAKQLQNQISSLESALTEMAREMADYRDHQATDIEQRRLRNEQASRELEASLLASRRAHEAQLRQIQEAEEARLLIAREEAMAAREERIALQRESQEAEEALRREREAAANEEYRAAQAKLAKQIREEAESRRLAREAEIIAQREERERFMAMQNEFTQNGVLREYAIGDLGTTLKSGSLQSQVNQIMLDAGLIDHETQIFWEFGRSYRWPRDLELRRADIDELLTTIMTPFGLRVTFTMNGLAIISQY